MPIGGVALESKPGDPSPSDFLVEAFPSRRATGTAAAADPRARGKRAVFFTRAEKLPLGMLGPVVEVDTERPIGVAALATRVTDATGHA